MGIFRRNKFFYVFILALVGGISTPSTPLYAGNLKIRRHNNFVSHLNLRPGLSQNSLVILNSTFAQGVTFIAPDGSPINDTPDNVTPELTAPALFYPNPFRLDEGAVLGYRLSREDMDISIRMYDMRGNQIFRKDITAGSEGAQLGYNKVRFNRSVLGHGNLPAGIYFYVLINNSKVIGKGKVAVKP